MFGKAAADILGLSDIGKIVKPEDFDKTDSDDYVLREEGERIFFLIKSKSDEYCFTNQSLIHLDGTSAMSKKRTLRRYPYYKFQFHHVVLETAGTIDLDIEIKFGIGDVSLSIDVDKKQIEQLKDLYKILLRIGEIQSENAKLREFGETSLNTASAALGRVTKNEINLPEQLKATNEYAYQWLKYLHKEFSRKDFGDVFEKYINN
ncbi:MAG: PH domain-containing protein [Planctomycetes bacterium]|nr:PH domain-containing protein [Planctomycetota bacterium]